MNLFQVISYRPASDGQAIGPIATPLCEGRCCGNRTAPVYLTFGVKGMLMLCADCRAWQQKIIRARVAEIRR